MIIPRIHAILGQTNNAVGLWLYGPMWSSLIGLSLQFLFKLQTGLQDLADTVVGGATGPGLSGGQKRRLVVALQLLKLPSVIFLDEPTSGNGDTSLLVSF